MKKPTYKFILLLTILFLSGMSHDASYARVPIVKKVLSTKDNLNLAPVTPVEIDFNDEDTSLAVDISALAPTTPVEVDFTDSL